MNKPTSPFDPDPYFIKCLRCSSIITSSLNSPFLAPLPPPPHPTITPLSHHYASSRMITRPPLLYVTSDTDTPLIIYFSFLKLKKQKQKKQKKKQIHAPAYDRSTHAFKQLTKLSGLNKKK